MWQKSIALTLLGRFHSNCVLSVITSDTTNELHGFTLMMLHGPMTQIYPWHFCLIIIRNYLSLCAYCHLRVGLYVTCQWFTSAFCSLQWKGDLTRVSPSPRFGRLGEAPAELCDPKLMNKQVSKMDGWFEVLHSPILHTLVVGLGSGYCQLWSLMRFKGPSKADVTTLRL